jgi:hypothetical protein
MGCHSKEHEFEYRPHNSARAEHGMRINTLVDPGHDTVNLIHHFHG